MNRPRWLVFALVLAVGGCSDPATPGAPSSEPHVAPAFAAGARVAVSLHYRWAQGATGTVMEAPALVRNLAGDWTGVSRVVHGVKGPMTFYWIHFDVPQTGEDGDGPFFGAEINAAYLQPGPKALLPISTVSEQDVDAAWWENKRLGKRVEFKAFLKR